jgi:hypothetical protein
MEWMEAIRLCTKREDNNNSSIQIAVEDTKYRYPKGVPGFIAEKIKTNMKKALETEANLVG